MRSFATLSALAVPALALSYSHGDPRSQKRHHQLAERAVEQRDVTPSSARMARKMIKRGDAPLLSTRANSKTEKYTTTAIWYAEAGWIGSCGVQFNDDDLVLGLPLELYPNPAEKSELCGQNVVVTNTATGKKITAVVADASQRDAYTTFTKGAYQALGGDLDVGELSVSYYFADADSISSSLPGAFSTSATDKEKSAVKTSASSSSPSTSAAGNNNNNNADSSSSAPSSSSAKAYDASSKAQIQAAAVPTTTAAPQITTPAYDSASAAAASKASSASKAAADAAWASSSSAEADKLWAASSSSSAAAAEASSKAAAEWAASSAASAAASASKAAADEAAAASKSAADAAWASSSSAAAAAATSAASSGGSSGGSGHTYSGGIATYFYQNGVAGNCGKVNSDSTLLVALPTATYEGGSHCGQYVSITRTDTGKTINALVADSCPTCNNNACLDLSWGAFSALGGTESMGVFDITWQFN